LDLDLAVDLDPDRAVSSSRPTAEQFLSLETAVQAVSGDKNQSRTILVTQYGGDRRSEVTRTAAWPLPTA
jgi:hypothetical protein